MLAGLLETYETAIAELERWDDPANAPLLESLRNLRDRALSGSREQSVYELAID